MVEQFCDWQRKIEDCLVEQKRGSISEALVESTRLLTHLYQNPDFLSPEYEQRRRDMALMVKRNKILANAGKRHLNATALHCIGNSPLIEEDA